MAPMARTLRPHQTTAIAALRQSLGTGHKHPMLQAPTGAGKTVIAGAIIRSALAKGNRVIFVVPAISLVDQAVKSLWDDGITDVGVIQANHEMTNYAAPVQVASVQTLMRRKIPDAGLVLIDEAHRWFEFYGEWMERWNAVRFVGLSATPWTKGLGKYYDDLIIAATTAELIDAGLLSPFRVFAPSHPDLTGVRTVAGDYHEGDLSKAMDKAPLVADVVSTWLQRGENRPTLCFGVDRAHAKHLQEKFEAAGVKTGYIDAFTEREEREEIRKAFHAGLIKVVCNVACLTTGVDWDVRCIILARPTKSEMLFCQIIGRGLRTADGKQDCLVLDHSDTHLRLGFVTDIHHDQLDDGKPRPKQEREAKEPLPKECPSCAYLKPAKVHTCPMCGFAPKKVSQIETEVGELTELEPKTAAEKRNRKETWEEKIAFIAELKAYAIETGKRDGWVAHKYRERYSVWPNDPRLKAEPPADFVSSKVRSWVRAGNIRYAKSRAA